LGLPLYDVQTFAQAFFDDAAELVQLLAAARPFFGRHVLHTAQQERDAAAAAQSLDSYLLELRLGAGSLNSIQDLSLESFQ
jgi:hypothetical protein